MMKRSLYWLSATAVALTLAGCGSDSDSTPPVVTPPEPPVQILPDNVFGGPSAKEQTMYSNIRFAIAKNFNDNPTTNCADSLGSKSYNGEYTSSYAESLDYLFEPIQVNLEGVEFDSIRSDIFAEGRGSFVDLLLHVAKQYDLDVELEWDEELQTHWIKSINGMTGLPETQNPDQYGEGAVGGWKMLIGQDIWEQRAKKDGVVHGEALCYEYHEEEIYHRMDTFPVKNDMSVIFVQAQPGEMDLRRKKYQIEMDRYKANGNQMIIPEIVIDFKPGSCTEFNAQGTCDEENYQPGVRAVFEDIVVKPHNLRPDLYQPGVLTELDAWLSLQEQWKDKGLEIQWSYWPQLSTKANVQGYVATAIEFNGVDSQGNIISQKYTNNGACGFVHHTGERENYFDNGGQHNLYKYVMCSNRVDMGDGWDPKQCYFRAKEYGPGEQFETKQPLGYMQGYTPFGGNDPHLTGDAMVLYNVEYINYLGAAFGNSSYGTPAVSGCDVDAKDVIDLSNVIDISKATQPLDANHFGWKQPDCTLCHNADNGHVVEDMKPWECAECHSNNGAPDSHGELMTCGYCHAETMERHGDAYSNRDDYLGEHTNFKEPESCLTCHVDPSLKK